MLKFSWSLRPPTRVYRVNTATRRYYHYQVNQSIKRPPLAFAFDIDGVLIRGEEPIPAARRALEVLNGNNEFGLKIPYILLTNGGGITESERCRRLSKQLGVEIDVSQYIQAHTILKTLAKTYADQPVLVLGGKANQVQQVAEEYGFNQAYTPLEVMKWNPAVWPLHTLSSAELVGAKDVDFSKTRIKAAFVFHDPRNWGLDIQVLLDIIHSSGIIGGPYTHQQHDPSPHVDLFFCNPDLIWKSDFDRPRLGQGAFREAFQAVYKALNGQEYPHVQYGKPTEATYTFAKQVLLERLESTYGPSDDPVNVYMVGDNPESDIAGANNAKWSSILVHTGVYDPEDGDPAHPPTHQASNVEEAVNWAIRRELAR